jgi:hypothetical protein
MGRVIAIGHLRALAVIATIVLALTPRTADAQSGGPSEGIQVHGMWTIIVRNADGSIASRQEFENALNDTTALLTLLSTNETVAFWDVLIKGPCSTTCFISAQPGSPSPLEVSVPRSGPDVGALVLSGSVKSTAALPITDVATRFSLCTSRNADGSCRAYTTLAQPFTEKDLTTAPIAVAAGQTIDATVKIHFTSAPD